MTEATYITVKADIVGFVCQCTGSNHHAAESAGYVDVYDLLMSDAAHLRVKHFLARMAEETSISESQRAVLLDGLAAEYFGCAGWTEFIKLKETIGKRSR